MSSIEDQKQIEEVHSEEKKDVHKSEENLSESEGEDVFKDSSEEESEEDEEEAIRLRDELIDDEEEDEIPEIKSKKRRRKRKRSESADELDDDDLDLVMENAGLATVDENGSGEKAHGKFKRLKAAEDESDVEEESENKSKTKKVAVSKRAVNSIMENFFNDDDEDVEALEENIDDDEDDFDDFDDFIDEDDMDDDEGENEVSLAEKKERAKKLKEQQKIAYQQSGLSPDVLQEMLEVFGDGYDYDWALEAELEEEEQEDSKNKVSLEDVYDLEDLKAKMMTEEDMVIKNEDIPERLQLLRSKVENYTPFEGSLLELEIDWISKKIIEEKQIEEPYQQEFIQVIGTALYYITKENLEPPYLINYKRRFLSWGDSGHRLRTLTNDDLWDIQQLDFEFHAIISKRDFVKKFYESLKIQDSLVETFLDTTDINLIQDIFKFLEFNYPLQINEGMKRKQEMDFENGIQKKKLHLKNSSYDKFKKSKLYDVIKDVGISTFNLGNNIAFDFFIHPVTEPSHQLSPEDLLEQIISSNDQTVDIIFKNNSNLALETIFKYFALEIYNSPKIRESIRQKIKEIYTVNVSLLPKGKNEIQPGSPYEDIKYAVERVESKILKHPETFLKMLEAEKGNFLSILIKIPEEESFIDHLFNTCFAIDKQDSINEAWNQFRKKCFKDAMRKILMDLAAEIKTDLSKKCENLISLEIKKQFASLVDQAPVRSEGGSYTHRVLGITCGNGNFGKDPIVAVLVDKYGKLVDEYIFFHNPFSFNNDNSGGNQELEGKKFNNFDDEFKSLTARWTPTLVAVNGFNNNTLRFFRKLKSLIQYHQVKSSEVILQESTGEEINLPLDVIFANDQVATLYQFNERGKQEHPNKPSIIKYLVSIARFVQNPLLEYINLSVEEISSLNIHPYQNLISLDSLSKLIEQVLVETTCMTGVKLSLLQKKVAHYLPIVQYLPGFGKRKALQFIEDLEQDNSELISRQQLITKNILPKTIFINSIGYIKVGELSNFVGDENSKKYKKKIKALSSDQEIFDCTSIHPEDYDLARKYVLFVLGFDKEEIDKLFVEDGLDEDEIRENEQKVYSYVLDFYRKSKSERTELVQLAKAKNFTFAQYVLQWEEGDKEDLDDKKINESEDEDDDYAIKKDDGESGKVDPKITKAVKLYILLVNIYYELIEPSSEARKSFKIFSDMNIFENLTNEDELSFHVNKVVPMKVIKYKPDQVILVTNSGVECSIFKNKCELPHPGASISSVYDQFRTYPVKILSINYPLIQATGSLLRIDTDQTNDNVGLFENDEEEYGPWDDVQERKDIQEEEMKNEKLKSQSSNSKQIKIINHPYFLTMNEYQAEEYLNPKTIGSFLIRPSNKGIDHLTITFKIDKFLYENLDVIEIKQVDGSLKYKCDNIIYHDLDHIIESNVRFKLKLLKNLRLNEKFLNNLGNESKVDENIEQFSLKNPNKSVYFFAIDHKHPMHVFLKFKVNSKSKLITWQVKLTSKGYQLFNFTYPNVIALCNGFKKVLSMNLNKLKEQKKQAEDLKI
ncbi:hypothetical protein QEN19_004149 [Hanseniaspora menglaensis]